MEKEHPLHALAEIPRDSWKAVDAGLWNLEDPIALGEGRAVVRLLKILSARSAAHNHRVIPLQDNTVISGSFTKGRSPAPAVNHLARQRSALSIASAIGMVLPWVPTTEQTADDISRDKALQMSLQPERT